MPGPSRVPRHTIGVVLRVLTSDFPGTTISKIRFLESEGLITPSRTDSGYRKYSDADVERLRFILSAQKERFWPLRVIREHLDALDRQSADVTGLEAVEGDTVPVDTDLIGANRGPREDGDGLLSAADLARTPGVEAEAVQALVSYGILRPGPEGTFALEDLEVARAASALVRHGIEVRHLRAFRNAADREVALVRHALPQTIENLTSGTAEAGREQAVAELLRSCLALHTALVRQALRGD